MPGQRIGSVIAAVFGLIYVLVNAGRLPAAWALTLRVLAAAAFIVVVVAVFRSPEPGRRDGTAFGRTYWLVVAAEFIALFVGVRLISGPLNTPDADVPWVSLMVGLHFFALAVVFGERFFHWLGGVITTCGVVGIVLAATHAAVPAIALVSGVLPGAILLAFGWWGAHRTQSSPAELATTSEDGKT